MKSKLILLAFLLFNLSAFSLCTFDVVIRCTVNPDYNDSYKTVIGFATGLELNIRTKSQKYDSTKLYAFETLGRTTVFYTILNASSCGPSANKICIKSITGEINAISEYGQSYSIRVF